MTIQSAATFSDKPATNTLVRTLRPGDSIELVGRVRVSAEYLSGRRVGVRLEMEPETKVLKKLH